MRENCLLFAAVGEGDLHATALRAGNGAVHAMKARVKDSLMDTRVQNEVNLIAGLERLHGAPDRDAAALRRAL